VISRLAKDFPQMIVGAGTVLDADTARRCLDAGAKFQTSTGFVPEAVEFALMHDVVVFPGALTPTEVIAAWKAGSDFVKVFPCSANGGYRYIKALKVSLPQVPMIASGGVNQLTALDFIRAGAAAIGVGAELIPAEALRTRNKKQIHELARRFLGMVKEARSITAGDKP
jgi:2-dehydro-3-deoxyphosphogluconate aldolase / (4S)-4-hydroxy-2-oxoglutarate aldolase